MSSEIFVPRKLQLKWTEVNGTTNSFIVHVYNVQYNVWLLYVCDKNNHKQQHKQKINELYVTQNGMKNWIGTTTKKAHIHKRTYWYNANTNSNDNNSGNNENSIAEMTEIEFIR